MSRGAQPKQSARIRGTAILDRLVVEAKVPPSRYDEVLIHAQRTESTAQEAILQLGLMPEPALLKYVAELYQTRFVSSEGLGKASVDPWLLRKVPKALAKRLIAFPILYEPRSRTLSIVAADIGDDDARQQMQFATGAREVKVYVAREAAIRAAVAKHYDQNTGPFEMLLSGASSRDLHSSADSEPVPGWGEVFEEKEGLLVRRTRERAPGDGLVVGSDTYLQTLGVLVSLIEDRHGRREGHAAQVAWLCGEIATEIGLAQSEIQCISIAAYLHDVGISPDFHVTAFDAARDRSKREIIRDIWMAPIRAFEQVSLPQITQDALRHRYERFDGKGVPRGKAGAEIPWAARVLAVAESYVELTQNSRNTLGHRLGAQDACDALAVHAGSAFDPGIVDGLRQIVVDEALQTQVVPTGRSTGRDGAHRPRGRGVAGSLQEMALPDVIQILANGRKSGRLEVRSGRLHGEMRFQQGSIHDARFGDLGGAEAVYGILRLTDGEFVLEPDSSPVEDVIGIPTHHLLLEAMRRLDEDQR